MQKITDPQIVAILTSMLCDGNLAVIPGSNDPKTRLDPHTYGRVNAVLEALGGKWHRSLKAHVFPSDAAIIIRTATHSGAYYDARKDDAFFPTPDSLVASLLKLARIERGMTVLEPSAGRGAIVRPLIAMGAKVACVEINPTYEADLKAAGARDILFADFLEALIPHRYNRVVMNPPFSNRSKQVDILHVTKAYGLLQHGGVLVAITSAGWEFRQNKQSAAFRDLVQHRGQSYHNDESAFKDSGTACQTMTVVLRK